VSEDFALFRTLSSEQRLKALSAMVRQDLVRGQMLVAQGDPSDSLFMVLHGALAVRRTGDSAPLAELRAGEVVGEIGFFANIPRTADVIAIRDTSVLMLTRTRHHGPRRGTPRRSSRRCSRRWRGGSPRRPRGSRPSRIRRRHEPWR
jgi:cAMP-binding proteins - catabolite gene activator and regulatory subunit of cAMP-dependent protein kinases